MRAYLLLYIGTRHEWCGMIHLQTCIRQLSDTTIKYKYYCAFWDIKFDVRVIILFKCENHVTESLFVQKTSLIPITFYWVGYAKPGKWAVKYIHVCVLRVSILPLCYLWFFI